MTRIRPITIKSFAGSVLLLLVGFHSMPAFADNTTPTTTSTTTSSSTAPLSTPPDPTVATADGSTANQTNSTDAQVASAAPTDTTDPANTTTDPTAPPQAPNTPPPTSATTTTLTCDDPTQSTTTSDPTQTTDTASACISNQLNSNAQSGNATVTDNGTAGNATTGSAQTIANLLNILSSSTDLSGNSLATFIQNITGNVSGDLTIDPGSLNQNTPTTNVQLDSQYNGTINNDLNLNSQSGNATVSNNGLAGDATSGNATAEANIINIINSLIAANQSFLGIINIFGNLNGNIIIPSQLATMLLGSNAPVDPATQTGGSQATTTNQSITNQVSATATSGTATVSGNQHAGDATTGSANTNVTLFNLTGDQIIGSNALLVFVNVLGSWFGLIMNAPAGTTAAAIGSGITQDSVNASPAILNSTTNETINNDVTVSAASGNASVTDNGTAGNATSGNALASVNILNILGSQLNLSNWFGILFVNVFGSWTGNLSFAPVVTSTNSPGPSNQGQFDSSVQAPQTSPPAVHYLAVFLNHTTDNSGLGSNGQNNAQLDAYVAKSGGTNHKGGPTALQNQSSDAYTFFWIASIGIGLALFITERILTFRQQQPASYKQRP